LRAQVVEPARIYASEEMGADWSWYVGSPTGEMLVIKQVMVVNVTDSAVNASLALLTTPDATGVSWQRAYLLWATDIAARSYFLWEGVCPLRNMWIYGKAAAADSLIFSAWGQYADFYE